MLTASKQIVCACWGDRSGNPRTRPDFSNAEGIHLLREDRKDKKEKKEKKEKKGRRRNPKAEDTGQVEDRGDRGKSETSTVADESELDRPSEVADTSELKAWGQRLEESVTRSKSEGSRNTALASRIEEASDPESSLHDFEVATFYSPTVCDQCYGLLLGLWDQGYRCPSPQCGQVVCHECLPMVPDDCGIKQSPEDQGDDD
eukprot:TRINITY_DN23976_c0_g1_i2.p1 TRINITY_DN23976_c0_g1~~TRINITY_DN23976_c0_g1_i2.p1  ORF type:complete len:202 (+),score=37.11 TRINITY_DN23976_c0_g1_i2:42-647(+)